MDDGVLKNQALDLWVHGQKHHLRGDLERAIEWIEKAKMAPRYEPRHFPYMNLGRIYAQKGRCCVRSGSSRQRSSSTPGSRPVFPRWESMQLILASGIDHEFRTTVHPSLLTPKSLTTLAKSGVRNYVLHEFRARGCATAELQNDDRSYLVDSFCRPLEPLFSSFSVRHA